MDANDTLGDGDGRTLDLDGAPIQMRLAAGSAIFAVRGEAWITQEGSIADVVLAANERFDVRSRLPLVVSATQGRVQLFVVAPDVARRHKHRDLHDFARSRATELRGRENERMGLALACRFRLLVRRLRHALSPRPRVPSH